MNNDTCEQIKNEHTRLRRAVASDRNTLASSWFTVKRSVMDLDKTNELLPYSHEHLDAL